MTQDAAAPREPRRLTDAKEMRALAHPMRVALLELLARDGPLTATEAGEALGESPANMSFHLRTLAKHGFVEEAPGGTGRQRPWQRVGLATSFELESDDTTTAAAAAALADHVARRTYDRQQQWAATRSSFPPAWREASFATTALTYLTPAELHALGEEVVALVHRFQERITDPATRPADAGPVAISATGFPLPPTARGN
jgi:DNA-binding transcriptional ArsR family regulator